MGIESHFQIAASRECNLSAQGVHRPALQCASGEIPSDKDYDYGLQSCVFPGIRSSLTHPPRDARLNAFAG